jgi:hypothetical protein
LVKQDTGYTFNHDFLFADREGSVTRFQLHLTLDQRDRPTTPVPGAVWR